MRFLTAIPDAKTSTETSTSTSTTTTTSTTTSTSTSTLTTSTSTSTTKTRRKITTKKTKTTPTTKSTSQKTTSTSTISTTTINPEWYKTPLAVKKGAEGWTGSWPSPIELPQDQRRDTACPFTFRNETRHRIKRWPDIIGIAAPKCGTGTMAFFDCHKKIVFREAEGMIWAKEWVILANS